MAGLKRQPPAGFPLRPLLRRAGGAAQPELAAQLAERLGLPRVDLFTSGREALRVGLLHEAQRRGREEVVIPAYTCYSVPASAVAAGLSVRLVDVTPEGWVDPDDLERAGLERAAALLVSNLFGNAEPVARLREAARAAGAALVDDAAQAFGARDADGAAGARGDLGLLSFARGKPLPAGGGGGLAWREPPPDAPAPELPAPRWAAARAWALAHDAALSPWVFAGVAALPGLHVGETRFDPDFRRGPLSGRCLALAALLLPALEAVHAELRRRAAGLAARVRAETDFEPIEGAAEATPVRSRLALRAPSAAAREAALAALTAHGASGLYPDSLDRVPALQPHLGAARACPGARDLAARLLTAPPGLAPEGAAAETWLAALQRASSRSKASR